MLQRSASHDPAKAIDGAALKHLVLPGLRFALQLRFHENPGLARWKLAAAWAGLFRAVGAPGNRIEIVDVVVLFIHFINNAVATDAVYAASA